MLKQMIKPVVKSKISSVNAFTGKEDDADSPSHDENVPKRVARRLEVDETRLADLKKDERYKHIVEILRLTTGLSISWVEKFLSCDEHFEELDFLINARNPDQKCVTFFFQESPEIDPTTNDFKRLFIANPAVDQLTGQCIVLQRITNSEMHRPLISANIGQELVMTCFDVQNTSILNALTSALSKTVIPPLERIEEWGGLSRDGADDFIQQLDKFVHILHSAEEGIRGRTTLAKTAKEHLIELAHSPLDCQRLAADPEIVIEFEKIVDVWFGQIEQVLAESNQMRREAHDAGPSAELIYWKAKQAKFANVIEEIRSPRCQAVLRVLHVAKSRKMPRFRELDGRVTVAMNEAKDNVKYLYTLDTFMSQVARSGPVQMIEHLPGMMNAIGMIYAVSQYYNTSDRMTSLFVKITNQMIRSCRKYILQDASKIWDIERPVLIERVEDCCRLNAKYQETFQRAKARLQESNTDRHFEFSENYVFGKFDSFCDRLLKILALVNTMNFYSALADVTLEGLDPIVNKFKAVADGIRRRNYDFLDVRASEFDVDYTEFQRQIDVINGQLQKYVDAWFEKPLSVEKFIQLLEKFEKIKGIDLDLKDKYSRILVQFSRDLDKVKHIYQADRLKPPSGRNLPPIASMIAWARQLYLSIEGPMISIQSRPNLMKAPEAKKVIATYNKVAAVLTQFELQYHKYWCDAVDTVLVGIGATVLVQHPTTGQIFVNFDPRVLELFEETKFMFKMKLKVPPNAEAIQQKSTQLKQWKIEFDEILKSFEKMIARIPPIVSSTAKVFKSRFEKLVEPGLLTVTWKSVNIDSFIATCNEGLKEIGNLVSQVCDLVEIRIEGRLRVISETPLIEMPSEEPVQVSTFVAENEEVAAESIIEINAINRQVEASVLELVALLKSIGMQDSETPRSGLTVSDPAVDKQAQQGYFTCRLVAKEMSIIAQRKAAQKTMGGAQLGIPTPPRSLSGRTTPGALSSTVRDAPASGDETKPRTTQRCGECENCLLFSIMTQFMQQKTDALVKCAAQALDTLRRRLQVQLDFYGNLKNTHNITPVFVADLALAIPSIILKPSLDEIQQAVQRVAQVILNVPHSVTLWKHQVQHFLVLLNRDPSDLDWDANLHDQIFNLHARQITDHKDVFRYNVALQSIIGLNKGEIERVVRSLDIYSDLWQQEPVDGVAAFEANSPSYAEYESVIKAYFAREALINDLESHFQVGPLVLLTEELGLALVQETRAWKIAYSKALDAKAGQHMSDLFAFFDSTVMKLSRPIKDLDDIRGAMAALKDVRDNEIYVDRTIKPIEDTYVLLNKFELIFSDGNAERVDSLGYGWKKLRQLSYEVSDHLLKVQQKFKNELMIGIKAYDIELKGYVQRYDSEGPMVPGIPPKEASERLTVFQSDFDDLWNKFQTYNGGEELFGLPITPYPELHRIKRELGLLQKLYQLYNQVLESVNGYYEIPWTEVNTEKINTELTEFQNRCRKLPKGLKEWRAYDDLSKMINDFSETCPLMELMSNKAMQKRHWERIEVLTNQKFDYESEGFCLRDLMKAPLLKYRDDIEDICISAVKEKDIEAKLRFVIADWSARAFTFASFKNKGDLLLKSDTIQELITALEDSLMMLGSLMSNRYNVPFKPNIQEWVSKLSTTSEIIERWMYVQNLWVYLEAVFVGGDIAKQLPAEAKRFSNIDKSWQNIMRRARENNLVIPCCTGDDTLAQILPHLSEQLELCQKSLAGYLEKKRLLFPRFFFVSDPQLLEVLGQASDSHTIQQHLLSIFDNTKLVKFDDKFYDRIVAVISSEGELIMLENYVMAVGNVEAWLAELLKESRHSVNTVIRSAWITIQDSASFKLLDFENQFPAQIGLLGIQLIWTSELIKEDENKDYLSLMMA